MIIGYLGPEGTFTHKAALKLAMSLARRLDLPQTPRRVLPDRVETNFQRVGELIPFGTVGQVFSALERGEIDYGVAAIDNTVEGPVLATIDGLLNSDTIKAVADVWLPIQFDAYALAGSDTFTVGVSHPHALAQVTQALETYQVKPLAAASNGAALTELAPGQIAFGPPGYQAEGVVTVAENVGDYPDAKTQFVLLTRQATPSSSAQSQNIQNVAISNGECETGGSTMLAITPGSTGPGVLARITKEFADRNLNLSALFSRPIKGVAGQYVFIVTVDASPASPKLSVLIAALEVENDQVKYLGKLGRRRMSDELLFGDGPRVAVIGLGLIGGSVVLRCVARGLEVIGYDADAATRAMAAQHFPVATSLADVVVNADLVVLAVPLCTMADTAQKIAAAIGPGNRVRVNPGISQKPGLTLTRSVPGIEKRPTITDVGSVKVPVRAALNAAGLGELYVGGHPMAGNEHSGFEYADPMLLVGAPWVLTRPANVWRFGTVFQWVTDTFDASVIELTDAEHDEVQALVSGLPHVLAVELLNQLWDSPSGKTAQKLIAGSFRDGTRVAFTDPERTKALVQENATNIVPLIRKTAQNLTALADALENQGDAAEFFHHADTLRNSAG